MGLLKKIGKRIKKVFKGVGKVFKKIGKFVGRAMASKWGKALMIAATIFTMGAAAGVWGGLGALGAAGSTASTAGGFFTKFVSAGKAMLGVGGAAGGGAAAGTAASIGAGMTAPVGAMATGAGLASAAAPVAAAVAPAAGIMAKAGTAAMGLLKSPTGAALVGNVISGYAQGKAQEVQNERDDRVMNDWRDPNKLAQLDAASRNPLSTPEGFMNRARRVTKYLDERAQGVPTMGPGDPNQIAQYAVGG